METDNETTADQMWPGGDVDAVKHTLLWLTASTMFGHFAFAEDLPLTPEGDAYTVSASGEIRGTVKYDDDCLQDNVEIIEGVFVVAEEVTTIAEPRRMLESVKDHNFIIDNREPYRDYIVKLMHRKENYTIQSVSLPAYNSPEVLHLEFDCRNLKDQIWDMRRARAAERNKKKDKKGSR